MKTPKTIYLYPYSTDGIYEVETKPIEGTVEYTRTDAFIEKAYEWLKSNLYNYAGEDDKCNIVPFDGSVFEDFRKYMENE